MKYLFWLLCVACSSAPVSSELAPVSTTSQPAAAMSALVPALEYPRAREVKPLPASLPVVVTLSAKGLFLQGEQISTREDFEHPPKKPGESEAWRINLLRAMEPIPRSKAQPPVTLAIEKDTSLASVQKLWASLYFIWPDLQWVVQHEKTGAPALLNRAYDEEGYDKIPPRHVELWQALQSLPYRGEVSTDCSVLPIDGLHEGRSTLWISVRIQPDRFTIASRPDTGEPTFIYGFCLSLDSDGFLPSKTKTTRQTLSDAASLTGALVKLRGENPRNDATITLFFPEAATYQEVITIASLCAEAGFREVLFFSDSLLGPSE